MRSVVLVAIMVMAGSALADSAKPVLPKAKVRARCTRLEARTINASELQVVGVVEQSSTRKLLLMDSSKKGYIIRAGECAGRERVPFTEWLKRPLARP